jgi:hypothetical protein
VLRSAICQACGTSAAIFLGLKARWSRRPKKRLVCCSGTGQSIIVAISRKSDEGNSRCDRCRGGGVARVCPWNNEPLSSDASAF